MLTQERLREVLSYDAETGLFVWLKPRGNGIKVGSRAGADDGHGYVRVCIDGKLYQAHRLAWLYAYGKWPRLHIDHVNRVKDDNRISNLRDVTVKENISNKVAQPVGETNGRAKLTASDVAAIRGDTRSHGAIASAYGLNISHVDRIMNHQSWKHIR